MTGFFKYKISTRRIEIPRDSEGKTEPFSADNEQHLAVINSGVARFKEALPVMRKLDREIFLGGSIATTAIGLNMASMLPFIPYVYFSFTAAIIGTAILCHGLTARSMFIDKYQKIFNELKEIYQWVSESKKIKHWSGTEYWYAIRKKPVQDMMLTLGPWVPKEFIKTWDEEDFKSSNVPQIVRERAPLRQVTELTPEFIEKLAELASGSVQTANKEYRYYGDNNVGDYAVIAEEYWERSKVLASKASDGATNLASKGGELMVALTTTPKPHSS
ncbi:MULTISPECIES: hypothetical protein [Legionella]|uniref:Uncharacterized protein n=1 Tax=Legionella drozanskii LLAP-1 TaxID=1212489 RepID=A0A0W0SXS4_9GAMM|nr:MULTISPECIES: hypothetical protein [Legionella]KTC88121.1 hypothetical protein Ldro_1740 [Legionella drozanskii LLAP-1]PJE08035.1 MAG: hypothetical protein CK430_13045 [Legionella sp.]